MVINTGTGVGTSPSGPNVAGNLSESVTEITQLQIGSDKDMLRALAQLSKFPNHSLLTPGDPRARRSNRNHQPSLRSMIESQQIASYKTFLESFKEIRDSVKGLESELSHLHEICDGMSSNLAASKQNSRNLIDEIAKLGAEKKKLVKERDLAIAYQNAFQLKAEELKVLRGTEHTTSQSLTPEFFSVFEKIQKIQSNVSVLMKVGHQATAVEIMDQMSVFQEVALEKIYRWSQSHCRNIENSEVAVVLSKALSYLQIRPMLLKYVIDEYSNHRRSLLVRSFIDVLTGVGNVKGIELIGSVEPITYVLRMLEWIYQSTPGEKHNLLSLLDNCNKEDLDERIQQCLGTIVDGLCRPLAVRIEQAVLSTSDCITVNKIDLVLQNYIGIFEQIVPSSNLLITLKELQNVCHQNFINQLNNQVQAELGEFRPPASDLTPSPVIQELLSLLKHLIEPNAAEHTDVVINMIVAPLVAQVNEVSTRLGSPDSQVYLMNCLGEVIKLLQAFRETELLCKSLKGQIDSQIDRLSAEQSSWLVAQLGIGHIYTILHEKIDEPLSSVPGMDSSSLKIFSNKLDTLCSNPESVLLPQLININDTQTRKIIQRQSFRILVAIYKQVFEAVRDPKNQYPENVLTLDAEVLETTLCS